MDIFETLRIDHAAIRNRLDDLINLSTLPEGGDVNENWAEVFYDLKASLVAHNRAEETVFYDVLNWIPNRAELADIKTEEHHLAEETLQDLEECTPADRNWSTMLALLKNQIESHIAEEETFVFSLIRETVTDDQSFKMGESFDRLHDEIYEGFYYRPGVGQTTPVVSQSERGRY